jgi:hypothetical protein
VDISDPRAPAVLPSVNLPGSLIAYDAASSNAITSDYRNVTVDASQKVCQEELGGWFHGASVPVDYVNERGKCTVVEQTLRLVHVADGLARVVDSETLPLGELVSTTALGDDRLFVSLGRPRHNGGFALDAPSYYYQSFDVDTVPLLVLSGLRSGRFTSARVELDGGDSWGSLPLLARGTQAVLSTGFRGKLSVVSAADPARPVILREAELSGYAYDVDLVGDSAIASLGFDGAQAISLAE